MSASKLLAAALLCCAAPAFANPPAGVFTPVFPLAARYPVHLRAHETVPASQCGSLEMQQFDLVDDTGAVVQSPYIVSNFQKFVLTDATWAGWTGDLKLDIASFLRLEAMPMPVNRAVLARLPSDDVISSLASGKFAFSQGPVLVAGTEICGQLDSGEGSRLGMADLYGYIQEDDPAKF